MVAFVGSRSGSGSGPFNGEVEGVEEVGEFFVVVRFFVDVWCC